MKQPKKNLAYSAIFEKYQLDRSSLFEPMKFQNDPMLLSISCEIQLKILNDPNYIHPQIPDWPQVLDYHKKNKYVLYTFIDRNMNIYTFGKSGFVFENSWCEKHESIHALSTWLDDNLEIKKLRKQLILHKVNLKLKHAFKEKLHHQLNNAEFQHFSKKANKL